MADIFISYARADRDRVEKLASALEGEGYSVWWDRELTGGEEFSREIEHEIHAAKAVIVAWSKDGAASSWVRDEASLARSEKKLFPICLDTEPPPLGFQQFHTFDFSGWKGQKGEKNVKALVASIEKRTGALQEPTPQSAENQSAGITHKALYIAGAAALAALIIGAFFLVVGPSSESSAPADIAVSEQDIAADSTSAAARNGSVSLGVIPFVNMSSDTEQEYFADGLTEELLNWLANVEGLRVPGRTASFQFKGEAKEFSEIGRRLGVDFLLEGSVRRDGNRIRITAQLIEAQNGYHLWSETYDREFVDFFALQDEVAQQVVTELLGKIPVARANNPAAVGDVDPEAHKLYLEGRALWTQRQAINAFRKFEAAIEIDPNHWLAQAYLAVTGAMLSHRGADPYSGEKSLRQAIDNALAAAVKKRPDASDVLFAQGWCLYMLSDAESSGNLSGKPRAEGFLREAIRANPRHFEAMHTLASAIEDENERADIYERIIEIEPGHSSANANLANFYLSRGDFETARNILSQYTALFPNSLMLVQLAKKTGDWRTFFTVLLDSIDDEMQEPVYIRWISQALADLGQIEHSIFFASLAAKRETGVSRASWQASSAALLDRDFIKMLEEIEIAMNSEERPTWVPGRYARVNLYLGRPKEAFETILSMRPNLLDARNRRLEVGNYDCVLDLDAHLGALALERLDRNEEADELWLAALPALDRPEFNGWRRHLGRAIIFANTEQPDRAFEELDIAYNLGFRFLYSYYCIGCIELDFYVETGVFGPIIDDPRFSAFVLKVEQDNEATFEELNIDNSILEKIEALKASVQTP